MNLALWIAAGLLATVALVGGVTKTFLSKPKLAATQGGEWTTDVGTGFVKALGVVELLAAAGLVLPAALGVAPVMVAVTAAAWILLMLGAMRTHARLDQYKLVLVNSIYVALALFLVVGRLALHPF